MTQYAVYDIVVDTTDCPQPTPGGTLSLTAAFLVTGDSDYHILKSLSYRLSPYKDYAKSTNWFRQNAPYMRVEKKHNSYYVVPANYATELHAIENRFLRVAREVGREHPTSKMLDNALKSMMQSIPFIIPKDGNVPFMPEKEFIARLCVPILPAWHRCDYETGHILPFPINLR